MVVGDRAAHAPRGPLGGQPARAGVWGTIMADAGGIHLLSDTPVAQPSDDRLGRTPFAEHLARALLEVESTDGFVFGVHGEWGSGKTSVLNLVAHFVEAGPGVPSSDFVIVRFNPWWYGTDDDLLLRLLTAMSEAVGRHNPSEGLGRLGTVLMRLGSALSPLRYVPGIAVISGAASDALSAAGAGVDGLAASLSRDASSIRDEVIRLLAQGDSKLLVVVDDIDRLTPAEMCRLFRVIKAVANFPKTVYLLAFDKAVVAGALQAQMHVDGEAYIEKVVQAAADLPLPDAANLHSLLTEDLDRLLEAWAPQNWDVERWLNTYARRHKASDQDTKRRETVRERGQTDMLSVPACRTEPRGRVRDRGHQDIRPGNIQPRP